MNKMSFQVEIKSDFIPLFLFYCAAEITRKVDANWRHLIGCVERVAASSSSTCATSPGEVAPPPFRSEVSNLFQLWQNSWLRLQQRRVSGAGLWSKITRFNKQPWLHACGRRRWREFSTSESREQSPDSNLQFGTKQRRHFYLYPK